MRKLAIIILNWYGAKDTIECLESLSDRSEYDIFLLDNGSDEEEHERLRQYLQNGKYKFCYDETSEPVVNDYKLHFIINKENLGFAGGNNYVGNQIYSEYDYIMLLNNDTIVPDGTIEKMLTSIELNNCIALTCVIWNYYDKNLLWNAGGRFTWCGDRSYYTQKQVEKRILAGEKFMKADYITGCALMIKSAYIKEYGLFTDLFFHGEEDFNFCVMAKRRNVKLGVDLTSCLYHKINQTLKANSDPRRVFNCLVLHYSNRIIDYKNIYTKMHWLIWREIYLGTVVFWELLSKKRFKDAVEFAKRVHNITTVNDKVDKELFDRILSDGTEKK